MLRPHQPIRAWLTLALLQLSAPIAPPLPESSAAIVLQEGKRTDVAITANDVVLEGHGRSRMCTYVVTESGSVHVWAASSTINPFLRATNERGTLRAEDDDSGGGKAAYLELQVEKGVALSISLAASNPDEQGAVVICVTESPETDATRAAKAKAYAAVTEVQELVAAEKHEAARERAAGAIAETLATPGAGRSELVAFACLYLSYHAAEVGELPAARSAGELALVHLTRTRPDDHEDLQTVRQNLGLIRLALGDVAGARELEELVLEVRSRTLPDDHADLQSARRNLAATVKQLGDLPRARRLEEKTLAVALATLPEDDRYLQRARLNLAATLGALGDIGAARALEEQAVEVLSRTVPADDQDLAAARTNLAATYFHLGDFARARELDESVLAVRERTLPDDHPDLQHARHDHATTLIVLGDLAGARALQEKVLEVLSRTLPPDHTDLQSARANLAVTLSRCGDFTAAAQLEEAILEARAATLPDDHPMLQSARQNLASSIHALGDWERARSLAEQVLEIRERNSPPHDPELQNTRDLLAAIVADLGDHARGRKLHEAALAARSRCFSPDHPAVQSSRWNVAVDIAAQRARASSTDADRAAFVDLARAFVGALVEETARAVGAPSVREAEERSANLTRDLDRAFSLTAGMGVFDPHAELERAAFEASESARGAALTCARMVRAARLHPGYARLLDGTRATSEELARLAGEGVDADSLGQAQARRDAAERALLDLAREGSGSTPMRLDLRALSKRLGSKDALVSFRRHARQSVGSGDQERLRSVDSFCAFVVRPDASLVRVELGSAAAIESAVAEWRGSIGFASDVSRGVSPAKESSTASDADAAGRTLRKLVLDPIVPHLEAVERIIVVLDDVLHLVPIDALPWDPSTSSREPDSKSAEQRELVGSRYRIETRATALELCEPKRESVSTRDLVALGDPDYDAATDAPSEPRGDPVVLATAVSSVLRGSPWETGFMPLPATHDEVRAIARTFTERYKDAAACTLLERELASREHLSVRAPSARYLHVATHGWFAPESIPSHADVQPLDARLGFGVRTSGAQQVRGMSPMLLSGLALAGANRSSDRDASASGRITAEELSTLDLSGCELAVLSACETSVGERRAGQGLASLQKALQMAGARSVVTSLWPVPDAATSELMVEFYRRLWIEEQPKSEALFGAKMKLRGARDGEGRPLYTTRDWAAWVLTGESQ